MSPAILHLLFEATLQTLEMVFVSAFVASIFGLPLGIILYLTRKDSLLANPWLYQLLSIVVNIGRSIPFMILMIAIIPITRFIIGTSIGTEASIVPLSLCAIPFIARVFENTLLEVNKSLVEAAVAMGASTFQIITKFLLPESLPGIINGLTMTVINLIGYSAMAGTVGGGGLGDIAIRYGYQRFDVFVMLVTIIIMIMLVQIIQFIGDIIVNRLLHVR